MSAARRYAVLRCRYEENRVGLGVVVSLACGLGYLLGRFA